MGATISRGLGGLRGLAAVAGCGLVLAGCATAQRTYNRVVGINPCQDTKITLYFEPDSDVVTPAGREIMRLTAGRLKGCPVQELSLLGLADPSGAPEANLALSRRRAEHVRDAFVAAGLPVQRFTVQAAGSEGAERPSGAVAPVRRQVDVTVIMKR